MTASLPRQVQDVFASYITTEYATVDAGGHPIVWPVTPYYRHGDLCIDITTGLGYPKKANDARANPKVALLFSDPTGCALGPTPTVLVQGTADVDDRDLDANRERYGREAIEKLPATKSMLPPKPLQRLANWYFTRIYVHVRPERVYEWAGGDLSAEPTLYDSHIEETRSGHNEEPELPPPAPEGGDVAWDSRITELGSRYRTAVLGFVAPDGFPFAVRVPIALDADTRRIRIPVDPPGAPLQPGLVCVTAHDHAPDFTWQRNFQVRGDLVEDDDGWAVVPHRVVGGFELPPGSMLSNIRRNFDKARRFRRIAKRELELREQRLRSG